MSLHPTLQKLTIIFVTPASRYFRAFMGVLVAPFLLMAVVGRELVTLGYPGIFWSGYIASLLLLASLGLGSRMYSRNAYQGEGLSISPTYKSKGWA